MSTLQRGRRKLYDHKMSTYCSDPEVIDSLKSLARTNHGLLRPESVVEAARPEDSPLHKKFEWDDTEAAGKFRLIQARALISISVEYVNTGKKVLPTKVFVSLSTDRVRHGESGYRTFVDVMRNPDMKNQLLMDSLEAMNHFQEKYKSLQELRQVIDTMQATRENLLLKKPSLQ